jgi:RHH-type proline utilization regulon transcriptional repressor/proline dehydrogenase/delta 1-pyrroline-5-carboxylate dehydrogenase
MVIDSNILESRVQALGREIFEEVTKSKLSLLDPEFYTGKLLNWSMEDENFKVSLFRFVDVFASLKDGSSIIRHAQEYFEPVAHKIPGILKWGFRVDPNSLSAKVAAKVIGHQIKSMAGRFIVGETPKGALKKLRAIRQAGFAYTVDLLGEATLNEEESLEYLDRYLELIQVLAAETPSWRESRALVDGHAGERSPINISVKLSALYSQSKPLAFKDTVSILSERLSRILTAAQKVGAFVYVDMEDSSLTDITLEVFKRTLELDGFKDYPNVGIVLQAYLRRTGEDLEQLIKWVRVRGVPIAVRLVKGAYWDTEQVLAVQKGWSIPVWEVKQSTDAQYEALTLKLLENSDLILPAFGSHNLRSLIFAVAAAELCGVARTEFELQALYGMAEPIKAAFVKRGFLVREYAPVGELLPGMSYLVRRLLENTSNESFLRQSFREKESAEVLLAKNQLEATDLGKTHLSFNKESEFRNVPARDWSSAQQRDQYLQHLSSLKNKFKTHPAPIKPIIEGKFIETEQRLRSLCPEDQTLAIAELRLADKQLAESAIESLESFFPTWSATTIEDRARILFKVADIIESRRDEFSAAMTLEAGKSWGEADADTCEAIDFLRYYAIEAKKLFARKDLGDYPGEANFLMYEPRGVTAVICPWNFPLAIPCGMFAASIVTGNCTLLKPAEQTSYIGSLLFESFLAAGLPEKAAAFLPGYGEEIGEYIVKHRSVSTIVFTGSKDVGLKIISQAAQTPGRDVKRVIAEMGGKNAIIIDDGADLDEAIRGVLHAAFGFSGQKCSACSRVYVVGGAYDRFLQRLKGAINCLPVGLATDPKTIVGPVIDREAALRILEIIESSKKDCELFVQGNEQGEVSNIIPPTVFTNIPIGHKLLTNEIFGPVLALVAVKSFDEGLALAIESEFALTGGVYSRSPKNIEKAISKYKVGNLYINRPCTGALVFRQPFGGFKMSGVGSKAGGPDYLMQFVVPRSVSENTLRRGFAPKI